jgi:hypothetical protein
VLRDREQGFETGLLLLGEQRGAGVEGAPRGIARVALAAPVPAGDLLDAAAALVQSISSSRAGPVPSRIGVRSMITVTYLSPRRVWRQQCSSTPITRTPSNRCGSSINTRLPSAGTASFAVFHDTPRPSATRATVKCCHTLPSSAHRSARRDSFARGSAARLVSWRDMPTAGAAIAADRDQQRRRAPPQRFVRQPPGHKVA